MSCSLETTVGKVTELMTRYSPHHVCKVQLAARLMARALRNCVSREGVHRVFVVDSQRHPWWVVSMTDLVARLV